MNLLLPGLKGQVWAGAQPFSGLLEETSPSLLFLAVVGKKGPSREGYSYILFA